MLEWITGVAGLEWNRITNLEYEEFSHWAAAVQSIATVASFVVAGWWIYGRYIRQEEDRPHIQSSAQINVVGQQGDGWVVELIAVLENKGKVGHRIEKFDLELDGILKSDPLQNLEKWRGQLDFPHKFSTASLIPPWRKSFFVGPGVTGKYSWIITVPKETTFLNLHCTFHYMNRPSIQTMEATVKVGAYPITAETSPAP